MKQLQRNVAKWNVAKKQKNPKQPQRDKEWTHTNIQLQRDTKEIIKWHRTPTQDSLGGAVEGPVSYLYLCMTIWRHELQLFTDFIFEYIHYSNCCFCHETIALYVPVCCVCLHTIKSLQTRPCWVQSLTKCLKFDLCTLRNSTTAKKPGHRSATSLIQTRYSMFGDVSSSHLLADHLIPLAVWLTDIPLFCLPSLR